MTRSHFICHVVWLLTLVLISDVEKTNKYTISTTVYLISLGVVKHVNIE